jgi:hypothetical protein
MIENQTNLQAIIDSAVSMAKNPANFYQKMPKTGGYLAPILFVVVMSVLSGIILFLYFLFGLGLAGGAAIGVGAILVTVIASLIGSFIGAAILFVIWKLMGSKESYETAYRCVAYGSVVYPVSTLLGPLPYLGSVIAMLLGFYLMTIASIEVHGLAKRNTYIVFGILAALAIISSISSQIATRQLISGAEDYSRQFKGLENVEEMTPEQAGKAFGEFLKGMEEATKNSQ